MVGIAACALAAGFGQFGVVAALGDVSKAFGQTTHGATLADQAGLSGTVLAAGLAVIRLASLGALPLAGLADRFGRRTMLLVTVAAGLALTVVAAASPGYWWFVVIFACGRPLLSATNGLAQTAAGEQTDSGQRARAVALVAAGYGVGAGMIAIIHSLGSGVLGFRGIFALSVVPLCFVPLLSRWITEPDRFTVTAARAEHPVPVLGAVGPPFRNRLLVVAALAFAISVVTGPADTFIFLDAQDVAHLAGSTTALMVIGAGVAGLGGLLGGRWMADHVGRRPSVALGMAGLVVFGTLAYSGSHTALIVGYVAGVLSGGALAPAGGAMLNELFPTEVRASVAGWWLASGVVGAAVGLVVFGAVADVGNRFGLAAVVTFLPVLAATGLLLALPETRGREPEDLWPTA